MKWIAKYKKQRMGALAAAVAVTVWMPTVMAEPAADALPTGEQIVGGAEVIRNGNVANKNQMTVNITDAQGKAAINWGSFNIGKGARVNFEGAKGFKVLNRVTLGNPSEIYGELNGNGGTVFLINPSGITFGGTARVEVGSLVASTLNIENSDFEKGTYDFKPFLDNDKKEITGSVIKNLSVLSDKNDKAIKATDNVVLIAHKVENKGTINGKQVNLVAGDNVTLSSLNNVSDTELEYDNKIGVVVKKLSVGGQIINSGAINVADGYVLMKAQEAKNLLQNVVNDEKITAANRIYKDKDDNFVLLGDVNLAGDKVQVSNASEIHAESAANDAGMLNILSTNVVIVDNADINDTNKAKISASALSDTLRDTNVNIVASPLQENYYSDITINQNINKVDKNDTINIKDTGLSLTAGRNISVDAAITSEAGKLDVKLNGDNKVSTKSGRSDGAVIIRSNIATNGGDFATTGDNGTYIGLNNEELGNLIYNKKEEQETRTISTKGGNISFGGNEVLLATGNAVVLNTEDRTDENNIKSGNVFVNGTINSANAYSLWIYKDPNDKNKVKNTTWGTANEASKKYWGENSTAKSYLAVITGALEDAVVSATIPPDTNNKSEAFVGGHVVAVRAGNDGTVILDDDGRPEVLYNNDGTVKLLSGKNKTEGKDNTIADGGWYKDKDGNPVRYWAWVDGNEKGTIFYVQTMGENVADLNKYPDPSGNKDWMKASHGRTAKDVNGKDIYSNFAPGEPNDDRGEGGEGSQTALSVNYSAYNSDTAKNVFYAKWDDVCSNHNKYKYSVVETDLTPSSLTINAGDVTLGGAVGNLSKLDNMNITASGNVHMKGSVQLNKSLDVNAGSDITADGAIDVGGLIELVAGEDTRKTDGVTTKGAVAEHDITTGAITAEGTIGLVADNNVTINGTIKSKAQNNRKAVEIIAQGNFYNNAVPATRMRLSSVDSATSAQEQVVQVGEGSAWKIYSANPTVALGKLNSNEFAVWSWGNAGFQYNANDDTKNRYIFKATPEVVYTANDKTKAADVEMPSLDYIESYMLNEKPLNGRFTANFKDGNIGELKDHYGLGQVEAALKDDVTPEIKGVYKNGIELKDTANAKGAMEGAGYSVKFNPGTLTVTTTVNPEPQIAPNPGDVRPQLDPHNTTNLNGSASYTTAPRQAVPGVDRVLGLQSAELPFFREENGQTKLYGTYDVSVDPDKVKMEPTAKVLPEPDQPKNQYREYDKELTTQAGTAKFKMTYNGSTFDIYPADNSAKDLLVAGDAAKNVDVESQALFAAFKEMGITLDDLDGVYTHFDSKKEAQS